MPNVSCKKDIAAPFPQVWEFVREMDNWAPLLTGYQRHEKLSDTVSKWFLKGELAGLTRIAEFKAVVTEWDERGRVTFKLEGINEPVVGSGFFLAESISSADKTGDAASADKTSERSPGFFRRLWERMVRALFFDAIFGTNDKRQNKPASASHVHGEPQTSITFDLTITAHGASGIPLNIMIQPMLKPVAEDLANAIADQLEQHRAH